MKLGVFEIASYRQLTVREGHYHKLSSEFYGPFQVVERVGLVAYKLALHVEAQTHPVFHVSQLKKCHGKYTSTGTLPSCGTNGLLLAELVEVLGRSLGKQGNVVAVFILVKWSNGSENEANRELYTDS